MRSRYFLVAPLAAAIALSSSSSRRPLMPRPLHTSGQDMTTLDDQMELAVTVYNSDIALVRDVRRLALPTGEFDLKFMDIAATVNPATVHFRSLTEPSRVSVLEQNYEYDLLEPEKLLRKVCRPRGDARAHGAAGRHDAPGGGQGRAPQLQQRAGLADRQGDRHRPARRSHPVPRAAGQSLQPSDAHLDAAERRRAAASRRGVVPRRQAGVERRLRAHRRARRQAARTSTAGSRSRTAAARRSGTRSCSSSPAI